MTDTYSNVLKRYIAEEQKVFQDIMASDLHQQAVHYEAFEQRTSSSTLVYDVQVLRLFLQQSPCFFRPLLVYTFGVHVVLLPSACMTDCD
jgi:hypothetical protein